MLQPPVGAGRAGVAAQGPMGSWAVTVLTRYPAPTIAPLPAPRHPTGAPGSTPTTAGRNRFAEQQSALITGEGRATGFAHKARGQVLMANVRVLVPPCGQDAMATHHGLRRIRIHRVLLIEQLAQET